MLLFEVIVKVLDLLTDGKADAPRPPKTKPSI